MTNDQAIITFLKSEKNASTSARIGEHLRSLGLQESAARKAISRAVSREMIEPLPGINLKSGGKVLILNGKVERRAIYNALLSSQSGYSEILRVLKKSGGTLPIYILKTHSFLTIQPRKNRLAFDDVMNVLRDNKFINTYNDVLLGPTAELEHEMNSKEGMFDSQITIEQVFLETFAKWVGKANLGSPGKIQLRDSKSIPEFGGYAWDLVAPSYVSNLKTMKDNKFQGGFIVGDIWLEKNLSDTDLLYFFEKLNSIRGNRNNRPIIPFFVFHTITPEALNELRAKGVITVHVDTFYGQKFGKALIAILNSLEDIRNAVKNHPAQTADLFKTVLDMTGQNNNLKSALFEFIIARLSVIRGETVIGIRQKLKDQSARTMTDADVLSKIGKEKVKVYECKALKEGNLFSRKDLLEWETVTLPNIVKWFKENKEKNNEDTSLEIEFCVTTDFHPDCQALIAKMMKAKKHSISFLNGEIILKELKKKKESEMVEVFESTLMSSN